jgi:bla regulator protein blaR1
MIASWMFYGLLVGGFLALAAAAGESVSRMLRMPLRWIWAGTMLALLALVVLAPLRVSEPHPAVASAGLVAGETEAGPIRSEAGLGLDAGASAAPAVWETITRAREAMGRWQPGILTGDAAARLELPLLTAWGATSALLLVLLLWTAARARAIRRAWVQRKLPGGSVRVSPDVGPAVYGVFKPEVVLPAWLFESDAEALRLALEHEREHVRAHDPLLLAFGWLLVALLPWNPAAWWLQSRMRLAVEIDCDARVLRGGAHTLEYGTLLVDMVAGAPNRLIAATALGGRKSHLERRIRAMSFSSSHSKVLTAIPLGMLALGLTLAACELALPTAAESEALAVEGVEERVSPVITLRNGEALYIVDGVIVTAEVARAIPDEEMASIEVIRGQAAVNIYGSRAAGGVIRVATLRADSIALSLSPQAMVLAEDLREDLMTNDRLGDVLRIIDRGGDGPSLQVVPGLR